MGGRAMTVSTLAPRARRRYAPPPPPDPVTQYALDVVAGRHVAGSLVRKACERHLADLANGHERGLHWDAAAATKAVGFFMLLRHYKGEWGPRPGHPEGDPIRLEPWQQFIVGALFGWKRADGMRRFRSAYVEVAKKNGKTLLAAGIALLLGFFDGEAGAEVYSGATKRDQAKLSWTDAVTMVRKNPSLRARIQINAGSLSDARTASFFKPLGQDSDTDQGINVHGAIIDELHVHVDRSLLDNLETAASARRQPVIFKITTAGVRRDSVWAEERADAVAVVEGRATDDSMLVLIYTLDDARTEFYGSSQAARYMIQSCTCRSRDTESTRPSAPSIPSDPPSAWDYATPAIEGVSGPGIPNTTDDMPSGRKTGQTPTASGSAPLSVAGRPSTRDGNSSATDWSDSGSRPTSTTSGSLNRTRGAPSAANGPTSSASTTTTLQEWSEGSSAGSATDPSASSGTLSSAYLAHSPTCAVRLSSTVQGDGLRVTIPGDDPFDEAIWPKANPNLGISVNLDFMRQQAEKAKRSPGALAAFLRFRANVPTAVSTRAIDIDEWDHPDNAAEPIIPDGAAVYGGLDLASVQDLTALILVHRGEDGVLNVECRFWCPEQGIEHRSRVDGVPYADWVRDGYLIATPGNVTDYDFVREEAKAIAERLDVEEIGYDRWNASQLVTDLQADGATLVAVSQTHAGLSAGWRELEKAILEHKLRHGGHPILRWMAGNVEVETDAAGNQKPSKARSSERIDGIVALNMAVARLIVYADEADVEPWVMVR